MERARALLQCHLPAQDLIELALVLLLIKELAAGDPVDLGAQFGNAILVGELHLGLARDQPGQHVVAEGKVGRGRNRPDRHDHEGADHDPECDRTEPNLAPGMHEGKVGSRSGGGLRPGGGGVRQWIAMLELRNRPVRHRRVPAGPGPTPPRHSRGGISVDHGYFSQNDR